MKPSDGLDENRAEILRIVESPRGRNVRAFGSALRGEDTEDSDLDLAQIDWRPLDRMESSAGQCLWSFERYQRRYAGVVRNVQGRSSWSHDDSEDESAGQRVFRRYRRVASFGALHVVGAGHADGRSRVKSSESGSQMSPRIEIFKDDVWTPAASIQELAVDRCRVEYLPEYLFGRNPLPIALGMRLEFPVDKTITPDGGGLEYVDRSLPPFLFDLIAQGPGRKRLVAMLGAQDRDSLQLPLLRCGAIGPIGNLRINTAVESYREHRNKSTADGLKGMLEGGEGLTIDDIAKQPEGVLDHLSLHAALAAGFTGVQGVAPKLLLAQNAAGRWFADLALPDECARVHWLVKFPRGRTAADRTVLRNEAAYLRVAAACGLRVEHEPVLVGDMLFVRRFDREIGPEGLRRLHQESLASIAGLRGFGAKVNQGMLLKAVRAHVTNPIDETIEFLKRDALNVALRNTDNHGRNTAVQRLHDGTVRLTPLYDFAPMFLDPEMVPRASHWVFDGRREEDFGVITDRLDIPVNEKALVARAMQEFAAIVGRLPEIAVDCGVDPAVLEQCRHSIDCVAEQLLGR